MSLDEKGAPAKSCQNCGNRCMDMDMDPYCAAVNKPWGQVLYRGQPAECGPEFKLWVLDERMKPKPEVKLKADGGPALGALLRQVDAERARERELTSGPFIARVGTIAFPTWVEHFILFGSRPRADRDETKLELQWLSLGDTPGRMGLPVCLPEESKPLAMRDHGHVLTASDGMLYVTSAAGQADLYANALLNAALEIGRELGLKVWRAL